MTRRGQEKGAEKKIIADGYFCKVWVPGGREHIVGQQIENQVLIKIAHYGLCPEWIVSTYAFVQLFKEFYCRGKLWIFLINKGPDIVQ